MSLEEYIISSASTTAPSSYLGYLTNPGGSDVAFGQPALGQEPNYRRAAELDRAAAYFDKLRSWNAAHGFPSLSVVDKAESLLDSIEDRFGPRLPVPQVSLGEGGRVMLTWRTPRHYLEIEVDPDGGCEGYYENESTHAGEELPRFAIWRPGCEVLFDYLRRVAEQALTELDIHG